MTSTTGCCIQRCYPRRVAGYRWGPRARLDGGSQLKATSIPARSTQRLDALTGLRWWAAFIVFFYHILVFAPLPLPVSAFFAKGFLGVTFFFVLSGFVLTWSARPDIARSTFYWRRFARVYPSALVALLLAIPVFYTFGPVPPDSFLKPFDPAILWLSVVLLQGWSLDPAILFSGNPAAWTLTVEMFFYALHPFIMMILTRLGRRGALAVAGAVLIAAFGYRSLAVTSPEAWFAQLPLPIVRLPEFVLGMALAWAMRNGWRPRIHPAVGIGATVIAICTIALASRFFVDMPALSLIPPFANELFTVACALAIVAVAQWTLAGRRSGFESKTQVRLGEWSYAFYLVHATFIYLALRIFGFQDASWWNILWLIALLVVDLVVAWALHHYFERPTERRLRRWKDRRDLATAARVV